jgi:osmotically-inducible protein OsmY
MPLSDLASLLEKHRIKRVPVMNDGKIVGIVSRANLIQSLVRRGHATTSDKKKDDSALHADIMTQLRSHPWGPSDIHVVVQDGSVELWGIVDSDVEKDAIRVAIEVTPGVRSIANNLSIHSRVTRGV